MLENDRLEEINQEIYKKFPYMDGSQPKQKDLPGGVTQLSYCASTETANGMILPITVKVKMSKDGKLMSISTSK